MKTFKSFLMEHDKVGAEELSRVDVVKLLQHGKFDQALKGKTRIYRGFDDYFAEMKYFLMDSTKHDRQSANTNNFYNTLVSGYLPNWRKLPKRNKSIICSTDDTTAKNFGEVYYIFPKNDTPIGVCTTNDFWGAFAETLADFFQYVGYSYDDPTLDDFNNIFARVADYYGHNMRTGIYQTLNALGKDIEKHMSEKEIDDLRLAPTSASKEMRQVLMWCKEKGYKNEIELFEDLLDPDANAIYATTPGKEIPSDQEVWISGTCLCIHEEEFDELMDTANWNDSVRKKK